MNEWISRVLKGEGTSIVKNSDDLKVVVDKVAQLPSPEESPESYMDYGNDGKFVAKTARGECAS